MEAKKEDLAVVFDLYFFLINESVTRRRCECDGLLKTAMIIKIAKKINGVGQSCQSFFFG